MDTLPHKKESGVDIHFLQVKIRSSFRICKAKAAEFMKL
jgi:hypothetical protein